MLFIILSLREYYKLLKQKQESLFFINLAAHKLFNSRRNLIRSIANKTIDRYSIVSISADECCTTPKALLLLFCFLLFFWYFK